MEQGSRIRAKAALKSLRANEKPVVAISMCLWSALLLAARNADVEFYRSIGRLLKVGIGIMTRRLCPTGNARNATVLQLPGYRDSFRSKSVSDEIPAPVALSNSTRAAHGCGFYIPCATPSEYRWIEFVLCGIGVGLRHRLMELWSGRWRLQPLQRMRVPWEPASGRSGRWRVLVTVSGSPSHEGWGNRMNRRGEHRTLPSLSAITTFRS